MVIDHEIVTYEFSRTKRVMMTNEHYIVSRMIRVITTYNKIISNMRL